MTGDKSNGRARSGAEDDEPGLSGPETKACPFCAEAIKIAAIKCRFCGSMLEDASTFVEPVTEIRIRPDKQPVGGEFGTVFKVTCFLITLAGLYTFGELSDDARGSGGSWASRWQSVG